MLEESKNKNQINGDDSFFSDVPVLGQTEIRPSISPIPVLPELGMALGLLVFIFGTTFFFIPDDVVSSNTESDTFVSELLPVSEEYAAAPEDVFKAVQLQAESAFVWDVREQRVLYSKNPDEVLPLASLTKLMTSLVAYELLSPEEKVTISKQALKTEGNSGLSEGEVFSLRSISDLTLLESSNDGAVAIGATAGKDIDVSRDSYETFIHAMNLKAKELGLSTTKYENSTGLDMSETEAGAYGSARDMAHLMEHIILTIPDAVTLTSLGATSVLNENGEYHIAENTNGVVDKIDGLIASKTGYTSLAGGNLVIAFNAGLNRPVVVSVLGSTFNDRFSDTLLLVEKVQEYLSGK